MKKLLLSLGALASVAAPVAAVVACGSTTPDDALAKLKKTDIDAARQLAKDKGYPDDMLNDLIGKINDAKTVDELTTLMEGVNHVPDNGGSTDNSGTDNGDKSVVTEPAKVNTGSDLDAGEAAALAQLKKEELAKLPGMNLTDAQRTTASDGIKAAKDTHGVYAVTQVATQQDSAANKLPTASAKATYDATAKTISVDVVLGKDDFKNHVDAEIAQAIFKELDATFDADVKTLTSIEVKVSDGKTNVTKSQTLSGSNKLSEINTAIDDISELIAEAGTLDRDIAMNADDYSPLMVARLGKVEKAEVALNKANAILKAAGNGSKFTKDNEITTVFGKVYTFTGTVEAELTKMLKPFFDLETKDHPLVAQALTDLYSTFAA